MEGVGTLVRPQAAPARRMLQGVGSAGSCVGPGDFVQPLLGACRKAWAAQGAENWAGLGSLCPGRLLMFLSATERSEIKGLKSGWLKHFGLGFLF